jgi:hypothetical protein
MKPLRRAWNRLAGSLAGRRREAELADELQSHIDMLTEENLRRGMSPAEARRAAMLTFGGVDAVKESYRDQRAFPAESDLAGFASGLFAPQAPIPPDASRA